MVFTYGVCTDVGRKRRTNEDSFLTEPALGLFAVADGMGGHVAGEFASQTVIEGLREFIKETSADQDKTWPFGFDPSMSYAANRLRTSILVANQHLSRRIHDREDLRGTGSTVAAVLLQDDVVVISNVGDCRVYRVRDGAISRITVDHSWVAEQVRAGYITEDEARTHPWRHVVTRSVAGDARVGPDVLELTPRPGDRFLLCSDGVHGVLADEELLRVVEDHANDGEACRALVDQANESGGPDNSTVILVTVAPGARPDAPAGFDPTVRVVQSGESPDDQTDDTA